MDRWTLDSDAKEKAEAKVTRLALRYATRSGERSEKIRTYNFPQNRVTDHRIGLTLYKLEELLGGALDMVVEPLIQEHQAELLTELGGG